MVRKGNFAVFEGCRHQTTPTAGQGIDLAREERFAL